MKITRDTLGHLENPNFILMKASGERVGVLQCTSKLWTKKHNDMDTLSFEMPYMANAKPTEFYDDIDIMKYIEVPSISAAFAIKDVTIENEGQTTEFKRVECQSRECELGQKYLEELNINTGTTGSLDKVKFYQPGNQPYSLLHLVLSEKCPGWSIEYVSPSLWSMQRSFEISRQDIYSFLLSDVAEAFECIFVFNSLARTISAYTESEYGEDTNLHVSYNNLLENTSMDYSIDDVKTCITLKGDSDDVTVREICMGYDRIYDFSVYASEEYMSQSLLDAYNAWQRLIVSPVDLSLFTYKNGVITRAELQGKSYKDAYTYLLNKYQKYYTSLSEWYSTKIPYLITSRKNPGYGTISYTKDGSDAVTFEKQKSVVLVTSLPSSGSETVLYLIKDSITWDMYRWNGSWVHVNHWYECALTELKSLQDSAENQQAVAMKAGYGDAESLDENIRKRYVDTYLPAYYMYNALGKQIDTVKATISSLESDQAIIQTDKTVITNKTSMKSNFTVAQLKELSTFIREDELSSSNFVITDTMTEDEKFEMLYALLEYGQKELAKVSSPQIQFSASLVNLFSIPEFDNYSGDFDLGNYVWVTLRDDYSIKAKILEVTIDFLDQSNFSVTFGNIMRKARNIFTDVTDALNAATAAATSVSFGASHWSAAAEDTDEIGKALQDGLLSQKYYLANAEDNETRIDENGVWITTTTGTHGREQTDNYDAIYLGGGRILYTEDGWRNISMSVGRADVSMPSINSQGQLVYTTESKFGVFADFVIAGYIGGSLIVGGDIYSSNYKTNLNTSDPNYKNYGNRGTHINLNDGTFEFNNDGKKRLTLNAEGILEVNGTVHASKGHIGSDDNGNGGFIIENKKLYNGKTSFNGTTDGIYMNSDEGISLGAYNSSTRRNPFSVTMAGSLTSTKGYIGGFTIDQTYLANTKTALDDTKDGVYMGIDGISLGKSTQNASGVFTEHKFRVDNTGSLYSTKGYIGGWTIANNKLYTGSKESIDADAEGIYLGPNGISLGKPDTVDGKVYHKFKVTNSGALTSTSGTIGGWTIGKEVISHTAYNSETGRNDTIKIDASKNQMSFNDNFVVYGDGSFKAANDRFSVTKEGEITATKGHVGGFTIERTYIASGNKASLDDRDNAGLFMSASGISLGKASDDGYAPFRVTSGGYLRSTSGVIGGWSISKTSLSAQNITISSEGSISQNSGNWGINSSGYAYFKNVYITGVNSGSTFGNMGYSGQSYNWGTFGGSSYYGSNDNTPFSGGCVNHIKSLAVDEVIAQKAYIGWASIGELEAESASIRSLVADEITATKVYADEIGTNTLSAAKVYADQVTADKVTASYVDSHVSSAIRSFAGNAYFDSISVGGTSVSGGVTINCFSSDGTYYGQARCLGYMTD